MHDAGIAGLPQLLVPVLLGGAAVVRGRYPAAPRPLVGLAAASAIAAVVHVWVAPEHFAESALYGTFFVATAIAGFLYAAWVLVRPSRALLLTGAVGNAAIVALWLVTRLVAVPLGPGAGETEPFGALDVLASGAEMVAFLLCVMLLRQRLTTGQRNRVPSHRSAGGISWVHVSKLWPPRFSTISSADIGARTSASSFSADL